MPNLKSKYSLHPSIGSAFVEAVYNAASPRVRCTYCDVFLIWIIILSLALSEPRSCREIKHVPRVNSPWRADEVSQSRASWYQERPTLWVHWWVLLSSRCRYTPWLSSHAMLSSVLWSSWCCRWWPIQECTRGKFRVQTAGCPVARRSCKLTGEAQTEKDVCAILIMSICSTRRIHIISRPCPARRLDDVRLLQIWTFTTVI